MSRSDSEPTTSELEPDELNRSPTKPGHKSSTGDFWKDLGLAIKRINISEDISNIGQVPCARNSLLSGIASGVGIGFIRGISAGSWVASNWAVGTFMFISLGTWQICRRQIANEHQRMQVLVDSLPRLRRKRPDELEPDNEK